MSGRVLGFAGFRRSVADLPRAIAFYRDGLGFVPDERSADECVAGARSVRLRLGAQTIELVERGEQPRAAASSGPAHGSIDTGFQHLAIVAADMTVAHARLMACAPTVLTRGGPVQLPPGAGGVGAFKFLDPDGHPLELIDFPPGSGDGRWQHSPTSAGPTLGIDHSAIVVSDVACSIAFYRDGLGFALVARQVNQGPAQEQLDGLCGAVVDVLALRPGDHATPHLELLGYRVPAPRVAAPRRGADCLVWWADDPQAIAARVGQAAHGQAVDLRDPDGHFHMLRAPAGGSGPARQLGADRCQAP